MIERGGDFGSIQLGNTELAGRDIDVRQPGPAAVAGYGGKVIVLMRAQQVRVSSGAGRDDARDLALDQLLAGAGRFHLIADGDAIALLNEARDVPFGRMIGNTAHGNRHSLFLIARGERDFELACGGDGIFEEELVEIAQAKE